MYFYNVLFFVAFFTVVVSFLVFKKICFSTNITIKIKDKNLCPSDLCINVFLFFYLFPILFLYLVHVFGLDGGVFFNYLIETERISINIDMKTNKFFDTYKTIVILNYLFESYLVMFMFYIALAFMIFKNSFIEKISYLKTSRKDTVYNMSFTKVILLYIFGFCSFYFLAMSISDAVGRDTDVERNNIILMIINNQLSVALVLIVLWRVIYEIAWSAVNVFLTKLICKIDKRSNL